METDDCWRLNNMGREAVVVLQGGGSAVYRCLLVLNTPKARSMVVFWWMMNRLSCWFELANR